MRVEKEEEPDMGELLKKHNGSRTVVVPLLAALWLLVPQFAAAQDAQQPTPGQRVDKAIETATTGSGPEGFYVMPMVGSGFGADVDGGSLLLGGAAGYDTGGPLSIEGEFGYMGGADQAPELLNFDLDTRIVSFMANALWHFGPSDKWRPYASIGAGVRNAEVDFDEIAGPGFDEGGTEFAWSFGGGFGAPVTDRAAVRIDLRYMTGDEAVPSLWRTYAGLTFRLGQ